jgi:hypothetical protein
MWALFFVAIRRYLVLLLHALKAPFDRGRSFIAGLLLILGFPLLLIWQALNWLGLLLDEVFYRGYRKVDIEQPLFVIGPPRTGTTFLHHVLASNPGYSTFRTWECLFGLSVSARKFCLGLARLDRAIGRPFGRLGQRIGRAIAGPLDDIHPLSLDEPEEDFLCLMPIAACFLLVVPFPDAGWVWRTARLDKDMSECDRRRLIAWYRRSIQKHMYVFGRDRKFLSKNASFPGLMDTLLDEFPDARVIVTLRDPVAAMPSQLSSLRPGLEAVGYKQVTDSLRDRLVDLTLFYFLHAGDVEDRHPDRVTSIMNDDLRKHLGSAVRDAFERLGIELSPALDESLSRYADVSRSSKSRHRYTLEEFGLNEELIRSQFAAVYERFERSAEGAGPRGHANSHR